jgi:hypothetical protein
MPPEEETRPLLPDEPDAPPPEGDAASPDTPPAETPPEAADPPPEPAAPTPPAAEPDPADSPTDDFQDVMAGRKRPDYAEERIHWQQSSANYWGDSIGTDNSYAGDPLYRPHDHAEPVWDVPLDEKDEVRRVVTVFVPPDGYDQAFARLRDDGLIILQGAAGSGKRAGAIRLLAEVRAGGQSPIRRLPADIDLRRWLKSNQQGEGFYLIDGFLGARAGEMPAHVWGELADALHNGRSYLVICASPSVPFTADLYIQAWPPPRDGAAVLRSHLRYAEMDESLAANPEVIKLLERQLPQATIYLMARRLKEVDDGRISLADALRGLARNDETTAAEWFAGAANDDERALWLALAVFNGGRFRLAQDAARLLAGKIRAEFGPPGGDASSPDAPPPADKQSWFQVNYWRKRADVELRLEDDGGRLLLPTEVVRLGNPALPEGILRLLWHHRPDFRPVLLDWLAELGLSDQSETRVRAATTVALLASFEYETVYRQVFLRWVNANSAAARQSLAFALGTLTRTGQHVNATFVLLRNWAESREIPGVWAAARAYGVVGLAHPRAAMDGWLGILARYNYLEHYRISPTLRLSIIDPKLRPLFDSLFQAIASFFIATLEQPRADFVHAYTQIVTALRVELEAKDDDGLFTLTCLILFLGLATLRVGVESAAGDDADSPPAQPRGAPALLVLVHFLDPDATAVDDLAWLLNRAIRAVETRKPLIAGALHDWLVYLEETQDSQLYDAFGRVLRALVRQPEFTKRSGREIGFPFEQWAARRADPHRPAQPPLPLAGRLVREIPELQR